MKNVVFDLDGRLSDKGELLSRLLIDRGLAPEVTVMVGDRKHDVIGARTAGLCDTPADIPDAIAILGTPGTGRAIAFDRRV